MSMMCITIFKAQSHLSTFILVTAQGSGQERNNASIFRGDFSSEVKGLFKAQQSVVKRIWVCAQPDQR